MKLTTTTVIIILFSFWVGCLSTLVIVDTEPKYYTISPEGIETECGLFLFSGEETVAICDIYLKDFK